MRLPLQSARGFAGLGRLPLKPWRLVCLMVLTSLVLAGCASATTKSSTNAHVPLSNLVVDDSTAPATLDPTETASLQNIGLLASMYVTLVRHGTMAGPDHTLQSNTDVLLPYLAQSWTVGNGGTTYTFRLRPGARFPDGTPTNAAAVVFTFDRDIKMSSTGGFFLNAGGPVPLLKSVKADGSETVVMSLLHPDANFLQSLASPVLGIVDPKLIAAHGGVVSGQPNQWLASHDAGSGPYLLKSYVPGTRMVLVANPTFFGSKPLAKEVTVNFVTSASTLLLDARSGAAAVTIGLSGQQAASLRTLSGVRVVSTPAAAMEEVSFPTQSPPFNNPLLREALSYAVPYRQLLASVAGGYGQVYFGPFSPAMPGYNSALEAPRAEDLSKARKLLAESGVKTPVTLAMYTEAGAADQASIATDLRSVWAGLGVDITVSELSPTAYTSAVEASHKTYSLLRFDGPAIPNAEWLMDYAGQCASPFNIANWCNTKVEALTAQASRLLSVAAQQPLWNQVIEQWDEDTPWLPVYQEDQVVILAPNVTHYVFEQDALWFNEWGS